MQCEEIILRTLSPFYLGRLILKKQTRRYIKPSSKLRKYCKNKFDKEIQMKVPLSFIINNKLIDSVPIGMMSINSINKNVEVYKNPLDSKVTDQIGEWALNNCQIKDIK